MAEMFEDEFDVGVSDTSVLNSDDETELDTPEGEEEEESLKDKMEDEKEQVEEDEDFKPEWAAEEVWECAKGLSMENLEKIDFDFMMYCIASGLCAQVEVEPEAEVEPAADAEVDAEVISDEE